jgi:hypothetical protein
MDQKAYFPVGDFDHQPDDLINIGQIFLSLKAPDEILSPPLQPLPEIHTSYKDNWETERNRTMSGSMGIWAQVLASILGLGGNVSAGFEKERAEVLKFRSLDTFFIKPTPEYIEQSMSAPTVKEYLERHPSTKSMFMVTGVKVARDAEVKKHQISGIGADVTVNADATALTGEPVSGGPKGKFSTRNVNSINFSGSSDFVFAYRLRKISIHAKTGEISSKDEIKGALYAGGLEREEEEGRINKMSKQGDTRKQGELAPKLFDIDSEIEDFGSNFTPPGFRAMTIKDDDDADCKIVFGPEIRKGKGGR